MVKVFLVSSAVLVGAVVLIAADWLVSTISNTLDDIFDVYDEDDE